MRCFLKLLGYKKYQCPNCKKYNYFKGKVEWDSIVGFCRKCDHPVWLVVFLFLLVGCNTYNIHLSYTTEDTQGISTEMPIGKYNNRFDAQFQQADSVFKYQLVKYKDIKSE